MLRLEKTIRSKDAAFLCHQIPRERPSVSSYSVTWQGQGWVVSHGGSRGRCFHMERVLKAVTPSFGQSGSLRGDAQEREGYWCRVSIEAPKLLMDMEI